MRIQRYDPETDTAPHYQDFHVEVRETDRILDVLMHIQRNVDGSLAFRKSCGHGVCGSDAMVINGVERLACKTKVRDVAGKENDVVTIEPLHSLSLQRDLMVDYGTFFAAYREMKPYLIPREQVEQKENIQSVEERARFDDPTKCILCAACYSACPVIKDGEAEFAGPAAIVQAARFVLDSRDQGLEPRLMVLDRADGVWPCRNHFACTRVCPRQIKVTKNINLMKREITKRKEAGHQDP
jgi:succinate dehydrogenase / fumarate reductase iron-sulfur subunit